MKTSDARKMLKKDFDIILIDNSPSPGKFKNFGVNILYPTGGVGAEIRTSQHLFKDKCENKRLSINFYYSISSDRFYIRTATGRTFIASDKSENTIMDADFYGKNSPSKNAKGEYIFRKTNEVITVENYRKLAPISREDIETDARELICEVIKDYLVRCQYRVEASDIKDRRPDTDREGNDAGVLRFNDNQLDHIAQQINDFVAGKRGINSIQENTNTSSGETQELKTGTENL